ncbi:MAG: CCA tRNA nucleotidyltransferase [Candidatus Pelagibacter bacterium]|jgi:tRNA nucleotidyltransferase/poly(A) polymerase|nr:CCA tRNA nucleotidyltransferase [Candidatus Pelagibacter bacterium]|tara:strand:+ start:5 stop:1279 length:1275 start_codon:yes stop_codon:yes gene_type:complete
MNNLLDKIFFRSQNLNHINLGFKKIKKETEVEQLFKAIHSFSVNSEIRYVGGCVRKIINKEDFDDIDLAVNLNPKDVCEALDKKNIKYYESGIKHGTITALINDIKFEITSLRKDIDTDGRHAKVEFSENWKEDASRRDFTINSIYADIDGSLFDPFDGKKDLENGKVLFIGNAETRIKEDYLRILRYIRFFLNYSKVKHETSVIKIIKKNLTGMMNISAERLLDELQKLVRSRGFTKLAKDKDSLEIISLIFPQLKNISLFSKLNSFALKNIANVDFILLLSLMIIDGTDNVDYFVYKYNLSKKDQKRLLFLNKFYSKKVNRSFFSEKNLDKILYFNGREALNDIIYFKIFLSKKVDDNLIKLIKIFKEKEIPVLPLKANTLIEKYQIPEGIELGKKLKAIEEIWSNNNFKISEKEIQKIVNN